MMINATLVGQFLSVFLPIAALLSFYLGKRKTNSPIIITIIGSLLAIIPPFALLYLAILSLKTNIQKERL